MEESRNKSFEMNGGMRVGSLNTTCDLVTLSADAGSLKLSCFGREYVFPKQRIERLSRHRGIFSVGLRIEHNVEWYPEFVVFWVSIFPWTSWFQKLKVQLEELGYTVET